MPLTTSQARDSICGVVKATIATAAGGKYASIKIVYDDIQPQGEKDVTKSWLKVIIRHSLSNKTALGKSDTTSRYTTRGNVMVQVKTPIGDGKLTSDELVSIIKTAYRSAGSLDSVWYKDVRMAEVGNVDGWSQTNVIASFTYDEAS